MKTIFKQIGTTLVFLSCALFSHAHAVVIDFDTFVNDSANGGEITGNEFAGLGVVFSTPDLQLNLGGTTGSSPNSLGADVNNNDFNGGININFTTGSFVTDLSFIILNPAFQASAFGVGGALLHTIVGGSAFTQTFDFSGFAVNSVQITGTFYAIDDVTFGTLQSARVPEPSTLALLGIGLLGTGLVRRRKKG